MSTEKKIVKIVMGSTVIVGLAAGVGYLGKKLLKESFLSDPSSSPTNFLKMTGVVSLAMWGKEYLEDHNYIPRN